MRFLGLIVIINILMSFSGVAVADDDVAKEIHIEALKIDAETIAKSYGISYEDAFRRLKLQNASGNGFASKLREEFADRLAGIYIEHDPVDRLVVRLTGDEIVHDRKLILDEDVLLIQFIVGQRYTKNELKEIMVNNHQELNKNIDGIQGMAVDEETGEIFIDVYMATADKVELEKLRKIGEDILGVPVKINPLAARMKQLGIVRGGVPLSAIGCTAGFVVKQTGSSVRGITTAGHCPSGTTVFVEPNGGGNTILSDQGGINGASEDVRWYKSAINYPPLGAQMKPEFYADSDTIPRTLMGKKKQSDTKKGERVCHRGKTTGYSCGHILQIDYIPNICGEASTCSATWVAVDPPPIGAPYHLSCAGGDSGGPWFTGSLAVGMMHSASDDGAGLGICLRSVYMSTDRLNTLGLELLYGS